MERCTRQELQQAILVAKKIWARRNVVVHGGTFSSPTSIIREVEVIMHCTMADIEERGTGSERRAVQSPANWDHPPFGQLKVNWDVAIDKTMNCMGTGVLIRNHWGQVCAAMCKRLTGIQEPTVGEAMTVLAAVEFSKEQNFHDIILEGDSLLVVQALKDPKHSLCPFGHIIDDAQTLLGTRRSWMVRHVRRLGNQAAHGLAKMGVQCPSERLWVDETPPCILPTVTSELRALSNSEPDGF
ncbi:uncharacterized protein LOC132176993 [Corylus avellana]|uniref:uncharacterized protein LOC132176993 n=1 Tax=Corylus avellana TaxID=13451 RepID=UPI00286BE5B5|nr:uncharacterized protein LOC132176993 [Corylus avellana]